MDAADTRCQRLPKFCTHKLYRDHLGFSSTKAPSVEMQSQAVGRTSLWRSLHAS